MTSKLLLACGILAFVGGTCLFTYQCVSLMQKANKLAGWAQLCDDQEALGFPNKAILQLCVDHYPEIAREKGYSK